MPASYPVHLTDPQRHLTTWTACRTNSLAQEIPGPSPCPAAAVYLAKVSIESYNSLRYRDSFSHLAKADKGPPGDGDMLGVAAKETAPWNIAFLAARTKNYKWR